MPPDPSIQPVVLCGGTGSRLWPLSRKMLPKQFVALPDGGSLLEKTFSGLANCATEHVFAVTGEQHADYCRAAHARSGISAGLRLILEPAARGTAAAAAAAALFVAKQHGPETVTALLPADHAISGRKAFWRAVRKAAAGVDTQGGRLSLIGIQPTYPATGYGYIRRGAALPCGGHEVAEFVEKPAADRAARMISAGEHYWNSGVFVFRANYLLNEITEHAPATAAALAQLSDPAADSDWHPDGNTYAQFPNVSLDRAVAEKTNRAMVVAARDVGWSDVGSWQQFGSLLGERGAGNRAHGEAVFARAGGNTVYAGTGRLVVVAGIDGMAVIDTPDALLVCGADTDGEVSGIYASLEEKNDMRALCPAEEERPWGRYRQLACGAGWKIKRIEVDPGRRLSLQSHRRRRETWTASEGVMTTYVDGKKHELVPGESCQIPTGAKHRMENRTLATAAVVEVQLGDYFGEDDITRYEDDFGRC